MVEAKCLCGYSMSSHLDVSGYLDSRRCTECDCKQAIDDRKTKPYRQHKRHTPYCVECGSRMNTYRSHDGDKLFRCTNCGVYTESPRFDVRE